VSADGTQIAGFQHGFAANQAVRWSHPGGVVTNVAGVNSQAAAISADGSTVVGSIGAPGIAFKWTQSGGFTSLGAYVSNGPYSAASAVSADGSVIAGSSRTQSLTFPAFRWTAATGLVSIGDLPGGDASAEPHGISADGSVIVGESGSAAGTEAFIWDQAHGMRSLRDALTDAGVDLSGWELSVAWGVSADGGTIVGAGGYNGAYHGFIAVVPEPTSLSVTVLSGALALSAHGRRRRAEDAAAAPAHTADRR
jgi:probable HAF family extracellular repeat protein